MNALLEVKELSVADGRHVLLHPVSLHVNPGEPLVILGETGSGKSLLAQAIMGILPEGLIGKGSVVLAGRELDANNPKQFRRHWGRDFAVLPQEPWLSLDPLMRSCRQVAEAHSLVRGESSKQSQLLARNDLETLGLGADARKYPHQLSGGMAQRVAVAAARAGGARMVMADEPTKGLDSPLRDDVAQLLLAESREGGGLLVITHDLALAKAIGGRLMVMRNGSVEESGQSARVFAAPAGEYTKCLFAADPEHWVARKEFSSINKVGSAETITAIDDNSTSLSVLGLKDLGMRRGGRQLFSGLNAEILPGQILGVSGPSGCGKSTLGDTALKLVEPCSGYVRHMPGRAVTAFQKLYQDPVAAFPRMRSLQSTIDDVCRLHSQSSGRVEELMGRLGLSMGLLARRPGQVSGGELQRLALLRIVLVRPCFVFADEPTSRLDPLTQQSVIQLLVEMAEQDGCALMLVSHDEALIRHTADRHVSLG